MPPAAPRPVDSALKALRNTYRRQRLPVEVSFRTLVKLCSSRTRFTHGLHPYPGRLLPNIPAFFLSSQVFAPAHTVVLDPFCGSGTVLLEAILAGHECVGVDSNPLARLITEAKTTPIPERTLRRSIAELFRNLPARPQQESPNVLNREYWFYPHVVRDLSRVLEAIEQTRHRASRVLFQVVFSSCVRDLSLADPRLSVPVRLRTDQYSRDHWLYKKTAQRLASLRQIDVLASFRSRLDHATGLILSLHRHEPRGRRLALLDDARDLQALEPTNVDLVITSTPYVGAQKYIRASSLSLTWLGLCSPTELRGLEDRNIGREHFPTAVCAEEPSTSVPEAAAHLRRIYRKNPLRARIAATYLNEMADSLGTISRSMRRGGFLVLIAGASTICGEVFPTPDLLSLSARSHGFREYLNLVDPIRSRALMTKRHRTASVIPTESIIVLHRQ